MAIKDPSAEAWRWDQLGVLAEEYPVFNEFLYDGITVLMGFNCTWLQQDIANFLQYGPQNLMIQAQRSQAKTTITAFYAVWCMIHDPTTRCLIFSAGGDMASEIAKWVIQIISGWNILECMLPDKMAGDRCSTDAYDIHWALKGPEKSPSVACMGITANMQGRRADILIADDIESSKNSLSQLMRDQLLEKTRDFPSICQSGRIIYLGTPQSIDSIYNTLPSRGYEIRVWPGRYPTTKEENNYGETLAPSIREHLEKSPSLRLGGGPTGDRGKPTDPILLGEEALTKKEIDQGPAYFQLQHMLDTKLADEERYPLKPEGLMFMDLDLEEGPIDARWGRTDTNKLPVHALTQPQSINLYGPAQTASEYMPWESKCAYIDSAGGGQNGDETVITIGYFLAGKIYVMAQQGFPGGVRDDVYEAMTRICYKHKVNLIGIEANFGGGAFRQGWVSYITNVWNKEDIQQYVNGSYTLPAFEDDWVRGQKELRICDTLEPVIARHALVINRDIITTDAQSTAKYPVELRSSYQLFFQMSRLTRDRESLRHDDRVDSLAGLVAMLLSRMGVDEVQVVKDKHTEQNMQLFNQFETLGVQKKPQGAGRFNNARRNSKKW